MSATSTKKIKFIAILFDDGTQDWEPVDATLAISLVAGSGQMTLARGSTSTLYLASDPAATILTPASSSGSSTSSTSSGSTGSAASSSGTTSSSSAVSSAATAAPTTSSGSTASAGSSTTVVDGGTAVPLTGSGGTATTSGASAATTATSSATSSSSSAAVTSGGTATAPSGGLVLTVCADAYNGNPQFTVTVDGAQVGMFAATASKVAAQIQQITVAPTLTSGSHQVVVTFLNDAYGGSASQDCNLYILGGSLNGTSIAGVSATMDYSGTYSFNTGGVPAASDTLALTIAGIPASTAYVLEVDGEQIGTTLPLNYTPQTFYHYGLPSAASHKVTVTEIGGAALALQAVQFNGATISSVAATLSTSGQSTTFQVPTPAPTTSSTTSSTNSSGAVTSGGTVQLNATDTGPGAGTLVLVMQEDAYQGDAQFTVSLDGTQIGGTLTCTATRLPNNATQSFFVPVAAALSIGLHTLTINFTNDASGAGGLAAGADRNLYLVSATYNGATIPEASLGLYAGGPQSVGFEVNADGTVSGGATTFSITPTTAIVKVGEPVQVYMAPIGGAWQSNRTIVPTPIPGGVWTPTSAQPVAGSVVTPIFTLTMNRPGTVQLNATDTGPGTPMTSTHSMTLMALTGGAVRYEIVLDRSSCAVGQPCQVQVVLNGLPPASGAITLAPGIAGQGTFGTGTDATAVLQLTGGTATTLTTTYTPMVDGEHNLVGTNTAGLYDPWHAPLNVFEPSQGQAQTITGSLLFNDLAVYQFDYLGIVPAGFESLQNAPAVKGAGVVWLQLASLSGATDGIFCKLVDAESSGATVALGTGTYLTPAPVQVHGPVSGAGLVQLMMPAMDASCFLEIATDAKWTNPIRLPQRFSVGMVGAHCSRSQESGWTRSYASTNNNTPIPANSNTNTVASVAYDDRYDETGAWLSWFKHDGVSTDPNRYSESTSAATQRAGQHIRTQMGMRLGLTGLSVAGGGLDEYIAHDGTLCDAFTGTVAQTAGNKFGFFIFMGSDWDSVDPVNYPNETFAENTNRYVAGLDYIAKNYKACSSIGWATGANGVFGNNGSQLVSGYTRLIDFFIRQVEPLHPMVVGRDNYSWNEFYDGHATQGARPEYVDSGMRLIFSAMPTVKGGTQTTQRGPTLARTGTLNDAARLVSIPYALNGGTALETVLLAFSNPNITRSVPTPAQLGALFSLFPKGGSAGVSKAVQITQAVINTATETIDLTLSGAVGTIAYTDGTTDVVQPLTSNHAADFGVSCPASGMVPGSCTWAVAICDNRRDLGLPNGWHMRATVDIDIDIDASSTTTSTSSGSGSTTASTSSATSSTSTSSSPAGSSAATAATASPASSSTTAAPGGATATPAGSSAATAASAPIVTSTATPDPTGKLVGVTFTQPKAAHPLMGEQSSVGWLQAIGGLGQIRFAITNDQGSKYAVETFTGRVYGEWAQLGTTTDMLVGTVSDESGTTVPFSIPIAKQADSSPAIFFNDNPHIPGIGSGNCQANPLYQRRVQAFGASHSINDAAVLTDPTGTWCWFYGLIAPASESVPPAVGSYPISVQLTGSVATDVLAEQLVLTVDAEGGLTITPVSKLPLSTATPIGTIIEQLVTSAPDQQPTWSMVDPTGTLLVDLVKGNVTVMKQPVAGALPVQYNAADGTDTGTLARQFTVTQGTTLPASAMTMTPNAALINAGTGQVIGTPVLSPAQTGGTWSCLDLTGFNPNAELGDYACPRRIVQDAKSGQITAPGVLSAETIQLQVTWVSDDGLTTCVGLLSVPVAAAPEEVFYVGQGMAAQYGANGLETLAAARALSNVAALITRRFKVYANADPNYYTGANLVNDYSAGWGDGSPTILEGVGVGSVLQPRTGGTVGSAQGGGDWTGKGPFVCRNHDMQMINFEVSFVNGSGLSDGLEAIRKDGQTYGNLTLTGCNIHDCNNGLETGVCHGNIVVNQCEFANCGTSHTSAGNDHNMYIGSVSSLTVNNTVSRRATLGHGLKSRARVSTLTNYVYLATSGGQEGVCAEFPNGGIVTINGGNISKAVMGQNPYAILYCAERDFGVPGANAADVFPWIENQLTVNSTEIDVMMQGGAHLGQPAGVGYYRAQDPFGRWMPPPVLNGVSMWLSQGSSRTVAMVGIGDQTRDPTPANQANDNNPITRAMPFAAITARPYLTGTLPVMGPFRYAGEWGGDTYANFDSGQHVQDRNDLWLSLAAVAAAPTAPVLVLSATNGAYNQLSKPNPYVPGTTWSLPTTGIFYEYEPHDPFAPAGAFTVTTNADGTCDILPGTGLAAGTVAYLQVRATAPTGEEADYRYAFPIAA